MSTFPVRRRRQLLPEMEGMTARWYARQRGTPSQIAVVRAEAARLVASLPEHADVLEIAPGPGYLAVELARLGGLRVTGLDISRTMVEIAREQAESAGVEVNFRHGDVSRMPFPDASFDGIVCQAAFKNFRQPVAALDEMYRVLRPGGVAVIQDMRKDATGADIETEVRGQGLGWFNGFVTRRVLEGLRRRAYTTAAFQQLVAASRFETCDVDVGGIGLEVRLTRSR
jgi:ubiquinone/menaquinone biosynthesis C-methylase UbiE